MCRRSSAETSRTKRRLEERQPWHRAADLETPALMIKAFANGWQVTKLIKSEAGNRVIVVFRWEGDGQPLSHLIDRHAAGDEP
jgi:hypothetical protein